MSTWLSRLCSVNNCKLCIAYFIIEDDVDEINRAPLLKSNMKAYGDKTLQHMHTTLMIHIGFNITAERQGTILYPNHKHIAHLNIQDGIDVIS